MIMFLLFLRLPGPERVKENSESVGWKLTDDDVMAIDKAFPPPTYNTPLEII